MGAITREHADQFQVVFAELERRGLGRIRSQKSAQVDPFLVGRAVAEVMRECTVRSVTGRPLLWNEYRIILSRADFEPLRALFVSLERDLKEALSAEVDARKADLVGELRITLVTDEADELAPGVGVVRVAFVATENQVAPRDGEMTVIFDTRAVAGVIESRAPSVAAHETVHVPDDAEAQESLVVRWPSGEAPIPSRSFVIGRPHPDPPPAFVALTGASPRINKQHLLVTTTPSGVKICRPPSANPVHVNGQPVPAGCEVESTLPVEISLSRGDLVVVLDRAAGAHR
jgi:hypothetical protein